MKLKELMSLLEDFNPEAEVDVVAHYMPQKFSLAWGSAEGSTKQNCDEVHFYVDELCQDEAEG